MQQTLEQTLDEVKKNSNGDVRVLPISDLVMMQMTGDFDSLLDKLESPASPDRDEVAKMIEATRESTTAKKLFSEIVRKTIEAQFGDKKATLRELGQNAIDSYDVDARDKRVIFDLKDEGDFRVLRVRDYGAGMSPKELVRDLLVPYNSGKEFDPTKTGEHGIGWYSIVDLADHVKVTTKKPLAPTTSQVVVFKKDEGWSFALANNLQDAFSPELNLGDNSSGTEVTAFIPKDKFTREEVEDSLYQYLGMVDLNDALIKFGPEFINSVSTTYNSASPVDIFLDKKWRATKLRMGVSKRGLYDNLNDPRFKIRNQNLEKILFTQKGHFIKYDSPQFGAGTVHSKLMGDMMGMGLDFWVEVPREVTLTKGRNNIIADHEPAVIEGMYKSFENLFLDVILTDERILYRDSQELFSSLSDIFKNQYQGLVKKAERKKFGFKRKLASYAAAVGSGFVDAGALIVAGTGKVIKGTAKGLGSFVRYPFNSMPQDLANLATSIRDGWPKFKEEFKKEFPEFNRTVISPASAVAAGTFGATNAAIEAYQRYGAKGAVISTLGMLGAAGAVTFRKPLTEAAKKYGLRALTIGAATAALGYGGYELYQNYGLKPVQIAGTVALGAAATIGLYHVGRLGCIAARSARDSLIDWLKFNGVKKRKVWDFEGNLENILQIGEAMGREISSLATKYTLPALKVATAVGALSYGLHEVYSHYGPGPMIAAAIGTGVIGGITLGNHKLRELASKAKEGLLEKLGLYQNIEEKREKKKQRIMNRITKKYMSHIQKDEFFSRIMDKKIINSEFYFSENDKKAVEKVTSSLTIGEMFNNFWETGFLTPEARERSIENDRRNWHNGGGWNLPRPEYTPKAKVRSDGTLNKSTVKLSIDDLIKLRLEDKLRIDRGERGYFFRDIDNKPKNGDYVVDYKNPVVKAVIDKMDEVGIRTHHAFDVKILEDRLDNINGALREMATVAYIATGLGIANYIYKSIKGEIDKSNMSNTGQAFSRFTDRCVGNIINYYNKKDKSKPLIEFGKGMVAGGRFVAKPLLYTAGGLGAVYGAGWGVYQAYDKFGGLGLASAIAAIGIGGFIKIAPEASAALGREIVNRAVSTAGVLNPLRYPGYVVNAGRGICNYAISQKNRTIEFAKSLRDSYVAHREKKARDAETIKNMESHISPVKEDKPENESLVKIIGDAFKAMKKDLSDRFTDSWMFDLFGYGVKEGQNFNNLTLSKLEDMTERCASGRVYVDFMRAAQSLNTIVSKATGTEEHELVLTNESDIYECSSGVNLSEPKRKQKPKLKINIRFGDSTAILSCFDAIHLEQNNDLRHQIAYCLLDNLIHNKAHELAHDGKPHFLTGSSMHELDFFPTKARLGRQVMKYLIENNISPVDYVQSTKEKLEEQQPHSEYHIGPEYLNMMAHASRRKLNSQKAFLKERYLMNPGANKILPGHFCDSAPLHIAYKTNPPANQTTQNTTPPSAV